MDMRTPLAFVVNALACAALFSCTEVPIDSSAPAPTGVLEGAVKYYGPRPLCDYDSQTGAPVRVRGRAVLLMFVHGNPPPPAGTATAPASLLSIQGSRFFSNLETDCLPESPTADDFAVIIGRSAPVSWPQIALGTAGRPVSYMVQGFYDRAEDFHPVFSVTLSPTAQDLVGAAVEDEAAPNPVYSKYTFGPADANPAGLVVGGLSVTLAALLNTEPPIFRLVSAPLASDEPLVATLDASVDEASYRQLTDATLELYDDLAAPEAVELREALDAAGLSFRLGSDPAYAFYVRELDFDADGQADPHPVLGSRGYQWLSPAVLMQRVKSAIEERAGIPDVIMVPALPAFTTTEGSPVMPGQIFASSLPIVIPPASAIVTNPDVPVCQIATLPPASTAELY
ncbi:MAG: hypothetical protein H5U40_01860, partial [Polyangiaceae bacterium]|nr:hypothetical protein [Polyangiaceae bacterium]